MVGWAGGIKVDVSGEVSFLCAGGVIYAGNDGPGKVLPSNSTLTYAGFVCMIDSTGVSCMEKSTGHGFRIASDSNAFY